MGMFSLYLFVIVYMIKKFNKAISGDTPYYKALFKKLTEGNSVFSEAGSLGLAKTMLKTLKIAQRRGYKKILWLEDDATFHNDFEKLFDKTMKKIPSDWSMIQFGETLYGKNDCFLMLINFKVKSMNFYEGYFTTSKKIDGAFAVGIKSKAFPDLIYRLEKKCRSDRQLCYRSHLSKWIS